MLATLAATIVRGASGGTRPMVRHLAIAIAILLAAAQAAEAKEWAQKMFKVTSHDFGHVAHGAKAEVSFEIQNLYEEPVHIADVRTSCGCTTPTITKPTLKSWEKGAIVATFNTKSYLGQRNSTLTVVIDKPFYAEVQLSIAGYIHSDVDIQPGVVSLGEVALGATAESQVMITYRGTKPWQITDVRSANSHFEVELGEPMRQAGQLAYPMTVRLKDDAPAGMIQDQLTVVTNDPKMPHVSLPVEGRVVPPLSVSPSPLFFGRMQPGQTATKQLVITGRKPFKIAAIQADGAPLEFRTSPDVVKKVHLVPVILTATGEPGNFDYEVQISTDLPSGGTTTCHVRGSVAGASAEQPASAEVEAEPLSGLPQR
jgi:hypothetical protein